MLEGVNSMFCHVDMDAFFVSAELRKNPELKGKPVVVGGGVGDRLGVVASASYEARTYGIKSGMPIFKAKALCPSLVVLRPHHSDYGKLSASVEEVIKTVSPDVYMLSIDEALVDLRGVMRLWKSPMRAAHEIVVKVREKLDLPCSAGISRFPKIAKFCAKIAKPNGIVWALSGYETDFLEQYPVEDMPYFGDATVGYFLSRGMVKLGDVAKKEPVLWERFLLSNPAVNPLPKSVSSEVTLDENTDDRKKAISVLKKLCQKLGKEIRDYRLAAREIAVKVRYSDFRDFSANLTRQYIMFDDEIIKKAVCLFEKADILPLSIRLVGVRLSNFVKAESLFLFPSPEEYRKKAKLFKAVDYLRDKYGLSSVRFE